MGIAVYSPFCYVRDVVGNETGINMGGVAMADITSYKYVDGTEKRMKWSNIGNVRSWMRLGAYSVYAVFTHNYGRGLTPDNLIRRALARKYGVHRHDTWSHCGMVTTDGINETYWHQTFPRFVVEPWSPRRRTAIFRVDDDWDIERARDVAERLDRERSRYAVGQLLNHAVSLWVPWMGNTITAGKHCSEALSVMFPRICLGHGLGKDDIDPHFAYMRFLAHRAGDGYPLDRIEIDMGR